MRVVVCITGASGSIYAIRLLEKLKCKKDLVISKHGLEVMNNETKINVQKLGTLVTNYYDNEVMNCDIASGRTKFDAVVVVPCSVNTLAKIAAGICDNLITRVATVALKEGRKLILVPREMPLSSIHLDCMAKLARHGVIILPACPAFYHKPKNINDLVGFVVERIICDIYQ